MLQYKAIEGGIIYDFWGTKDDKENMSYQTIKVKKDLLQAFRQAVQDNGQQVNTVFREFMEGYIKENTIE